MIALIGVIGNVNWRATFAMYGLALVALVAAALVLVEAGTELDPDARAPDGNTAQARKLPWRTLLRISAIAVPGSVAFYLAPTELSYLLEGVGITSPSASANVTAVGLVLGPVGALWSRRLTHVRDRHDLRARPGTARGVGIVRWRMVVLLHHCAICHATGDCRSALPNGWAGYISHRSRCNRRLKRDLAVGGPCVA
jgi:hypothetical protein